MTVRRGIVGVLLLGVSASAQPTPNDKPLSMKYDGARQEGPVGVKPVVILDDAAQAHGGVASGGSSEAVVFDQPNDSGFGWFMKQDDVFGYGTWASQAVFSNGWTAGDTISSYTMRFFHSTSDNESFGDGTVSTELWNGDPFSILETPCAGGNGGINTPIAGTQAVFTGLGYGTVFDLTAQLPAKVVVDCDRVWIAMTFVEGCRGAWSIVGTDGGTWNAAPTVGSSNGVWLLWACEQFGGCLTQTGYNSGTCCAFGPGDPNETCDHANVDLVGDLIDPCSTTAAAAVTFCGDGVADYFVALIHEQGHFRGLVSSVSAATDTTVRLVPVSVDAPPAGGSSADVVSLSGSDLVLRSGGHNVWLEFRISDWDPNDVGVQLEAWQIRLDASSLASGDQGEITANTAGGSGTCASDADCAAILGPGGACDPPGYYKTGQFGSGYCSYLFIDSNRDDFVFDPGLGTQGAIVVTDVSTVNVRPAATAALIRGPDDPEPFPENGLYAATLTLHVPSDAKGTFTIEPFPFPPSQLVNQYSQFIPLLGIAPAKITVQTGQCCFNLEDLTPGGRGCLDQLMTEDTCAQMPGLTRFAPGGSCNDPCPTTCGDGVIEPGEECDDGLENSDTDPDACRTDCTLPICGDGAIDTDEACDTGSLNSNTNADACRIDCTLPTCGDDVRDTGEECDGSSDALCSGACRENCACGFCGDGILDTSLGEECDLDGSGCPTGRCFADCTCDTNVPTVSQWGVVILSLLLLTGAKAIFRRPGTSV